MYAVAVGADVALVVVVVVVVDDDDGSVDGADDDDVDGVVVVGCVIRSLLRLRAIVVWVQCKKKELFTFESRFVENLGNV